MVSNTLVSKIRKGIRGLAAAGALGAVSAGAVLGYAAHRINDTSMIDLSREKVKGLLYSNSKVYYSDGRTEIGDLGGAEEQRRYIPISNIPPYCIDAVVSAEDKNFWEHKGLDYRAIARAAFADIKASIKRGRKTIVQGGSTLTQQAAKNILHLRKGKGRSFGGKIEEAQYAVWLETNFNKKEILEMLLNQFHVIGSNVGIGSAAKYYFNIDEVKKLDLAECAFIAGTFKAPRHYDPFMGSREKKIGRLETRVSYVLRRMKEDGKISDEEYSSAFKELKKGLPFNRGDIIPASNTLVDRVIKEIERSDEIQHLLEKNGVDLDKLSTEGIKITTTVDKDAQREVVYAAKQLATEVQGWLKGFNIPDMPRYYKIPPIEKHKFYYGKILSIGGDEIRVKLDGHEGIVDKEGIRRVVSFDKRHKSRRRNVKVKEKDISSFIQRLKKGDALYISVREKAKGRIILDIEQPPSFEVANLYMDKTGAVKVLQGSYDNKDFDYIFDGKTQVGSSLKPFLQTLALQYLWEPYDELDNIPKLFPVFKRDFTVEPYIPLNHGSTNKDKTTLWYALVHSENVAHINLLYHLLDKIKESPEELKLAMGSAGMLRKDEESVRQYRHRLENDFGLLFTPRYKKAIDFEKNKKRFIEENHLEGKIAEAVSKIHPDYMIDDEKVSVKQRDIIIDFFNSSYSVVKRKLGDAKDAVRNITQRAERLRSLLDSEYTPLEDIIDASRGFDISGKRLRYSAESAVPLSQSDLVRLTKDPAYFDDFIENASQFALVDGIPQSFFDYMEENTHELRSEEEYLDIENIRYHPAFSAVLGEQLFHKLLNEMGLKSSPPTVPSMVLGAFEMHPSELVIMYNSLLNRQRAAPYMILKIEGSDGNEIYTRNEKPDKVVIDEDVGRIIKNTLRDITRYGTAGYLNAVSCGRDSIADYSGKVNYPAGGKTGTLPDNRGGLFTVYFDDVVGTSIIGSYHVKSDANSPITFGENKVWGSSVLPVTAAAITALKKEDVSLPMVKPTKYHIDTFTGEEIKVPCEHPSGNPYCCVHPTGPDSREVIPAAYL